MTRTFLRRGHRQKFGHLGDDGVQIDLGHRELPPARVREHLAGQFGEPPGGALDFLQMPAPRRGVARHERREHFGVAEDGGEQVVEIVRDPARQHAEAFQLLALPERLLRLDARGDVHHDPAPADAPGLPARSPR